VLQALGEAEHVGDHLEPVRVEAVAVNVLRDGDIAAGVERRQQVEPLKHEADLVLRSLVRSASLMVVKVVAVHQDAPARSLRQARPARRAVRTCRSPKGPSRRRTLREAP
jgi:hypothetical protein